MAEFEYLLWNTGHNDALQRALFAYQKQSTNQAVIAESVKQALKSFDIHRLYDELHQDMLQIALKNRLRK